MTVWLKQGVCGKLSRRAQKCLGQMHDLHAEAGTDLFVTSKGEGSHKAGSLHYTEDAFDFRQGTFTIDQYRTAAGPGFDVLPFVAPGGQRCIHVEYDPK